MRERQPIGAMNKLVRVGLIAGGLFASGCRPDEGNIPTNISTSAIMQFPGNLSLTHPSPHTYDLKPSDNDPWPGVYWSGDKVKEFIMQHCSIDLILDEKRSIGLGIRRKTFVVSEADCVPDLPVSVTSTLNPTTTLTPLSKR